MIKKQVLAAAAMASLIPLTLSSSNFRTTASGLFHCEQRAARVLAPSPSMNVYLQQNTCSESEATRS